MIFDYEDNRLPTRPGSRGTCRFCGEEIILELMVTLVWHHVDDLTDLDHDAEFGGPA